MWHSCEHSCPSGLQDDYSLKGKDHKFVCTNLRKHLQGLLWSDLVESAVKIKLPAGKHGRGILRGTREWVRSGER